jgi:hypothetical protein
MDDLHVYWIMLDPLFVIEQKHGLTPRHSSFSIDEGWHDLHPRHMPRKMRVEYPGAIYHVMSRGDRGEDIFLDDVDRQDFLETLAEAWQKTGLQIHAYCLMRNHFHLVVETPNGKESAPEATAPKN